MAGELRGAELALEGRRLPDLDSRFRLDGRSARLEIPDLRLGADNRAAFSAVLGLEKNLPLELNLQADFPDPASWMASFGLAFPKERAQAVLHAEGRASMALADVLNGDLDPLQADLKVQVTDIAWDGQPLGPLQLQLQAREGKLQLHNLRLEADGRNSLAVTGAMDLRPPHAYTAEGSANLTKLAVFNALTQSFGVPELLAGTAQASLSATGQILPWACQGAA